MTVKVVNRSFKYVPACGTDIRKTFKHERRRLAPQSRKQSAVVHVLEAKRQEQA
jgi:hypothetical protein